VSAHAGSTGVLFDVGYCLLDESARLGRALDWLAAALTAGGRPASPSGLHALYEAACRAPDPTQPSLVVQTLLAIGLPLPDAQSMRRALPWDAVPLTPYPDTLAILRELRDAGFRVGVLANQPSSAQRDLDGAGISALCDGVWLSEAVGLAKPDPRFFRVALTAWGLAPARVAYVGDRRDNDVAPAKALGMATVRLRVGPHADQPARGAGEVPTMEALSLAEVVPQLRRWRASLHARPGAGAVSRPSR